MAGELGELLGFLHDRNPQVRQIALSNLLGHTPKGSTHRDIFFAGLSGGLKGSSENQVTRDLKLLCRDQTTIAHDAFRALVNLCDSPLLTPSLIEPSYLSFIVSYILHPPSVLADLASMLLSNLTANAAACASLLSLEIPVFLYPSAIPPFYPYHSRCATSPSPTDVPSGDPLIVPALPLLLQAFGQGAHTSPAAEAKTRTRKGELHFLATVFANISVTAPGRMFFVTPRPVDVLRTGTEGALEYPLSQLVIFTEHKDTIRRGGVTSTIKNCAFHKPAHQALFTPETESVSVPPSSVTAPGINALPYILLPLAGPEEFDSEDQENLHPALQLLPDTKKRETDPVLRLTHVETLLILGTTRWGREFQRSNGVYEIVRTMHKTEPDDKIAEYVHRLVNLLKRDEGAEVVEEDVETLPEPEKEQGQKPVAGKDDNASDDEDSKIEEV